MDVNYYELLEIKETATEKEIKIAYRKKIRLYHPDLNKGEEAEKMAKLLNQAKTVLLDPNKRAEHDLWNTSYTPPTRDYSSTASPQDYWSDIDDVYKEAQKQQEELRKNKTNWTYSGKSAKSRVKKVRVKTSEGYFDIEFRS